MSAGYRLIPWLRQGVAAEIPVLDTLDSELPGRAELPVSFRINSRNPAIEVSVRLYGPGDITGVDARQVVRTVPNRFARNVEPNFFTSIEFDRPDFPWLFTPARAEPIRERLRPWICLVVVRQQEGVRVGSAGGQPLPVLEIQGPARPATELPDLAESWAWAHAQIFSDVTDLDDAIERNPERLVSRLLAPRRLESRARYYACLVPAFDAGRKSGLGLSITREDEQSLKPAWESGVAAPTGIVLPVYYFWEFATGEHGDFESLVRRLQPRSVPAGTGSRTVVVEKIGLDLPDLGPLELEGALRPPVTAPRPPDAVPTEFQEALRTLLNLPEKLRSGDATDPVVAPPIYGRWQTARSEVPQADIDLLWLRNLNLHPLHRATAGYGTLVVQDQQEQLMASAWEQLGQVERVNQELQQTQLSIEVGRSIHERLQALTSDQLFQITGPVHSRILLRGRTIHVRAGETRLPSGAVSPQFRRIIRPRGPLNRRIHPPSDRFARPLIGRLATGDLVVVPAQTGPRAFVFASLTPTASAVPSLIDAERDRFRQAATVHEKNYKRTYQSKLLSVRPTLKLNELQQSLLENLNPQTTITARVRARLKVPQESDLRGDVVEPISAAPEFPQPMYEALRDISQELLVPGLDQISPESVTLMESNPRFIEAYMVGLNHEMSRELLWRRFPTNQRATYFRRFWDTINTTQFEDIHAWNRELGENFQLGRDEGQLVLLVRGELLSRFPNTVVYAVEGVWEDTVEDGVVVRRRRPSTELEHERYPLFRGSLKPDFTFLGFNLTPTEVVGTLDAAGNPDPTGHPGWFIVFQEQPTEPRFGLDVATIFGGKPAAWDELSWGHLVENEAELNELDYVRVSADLPDTSAITDPPGVAWAFNAAHQAFATLQRPARVVIHAKALVPVDSAEDA